MRDHRDLGSAIPQGNVTKEALETVQRLPMRERLSPVIRETKEVLATGVARLDQSVDEGAPVVGLGKPPQEGILL